jgi:hypothetical protein
MAAKTRTTKTARSEGKWQGMNWLRPAKRLAIYLRDGLACAWCGQGLESGTIFTLDHLKPHSKGGSNHETNLVTCCKHCNDSRGKRTQREFAEGVAAYLNHGVKAEDILGHVRRTSARSLKPFVSQAKELIELRGGFSKAMAHLGGAK